MSLHHIYAQSETQPIANRNIVGFYIFTTHNRYNWTFDFITLKISNISFSKMFLENYALMQKKKENFEKSCVVYTKLNQYYNGGHAAHAWHTGYSYDPQLYPR